MNYTPAIKALYIIENDSKHQITKARKAMLDSIGNEYQGINDLLNMTTIREHQATLSQCRAIRQSMYNEVTGIEALRRELQHLATKLIARKTLANQAANGGQLLRKYHHLSRADAINKDIKSTRARISELEALEAVKDKAKFKQEEAIDERIEVLRGKIKKLNNSIEMHRSVMASTPYTESLLISAQRINVYKEERAVFQKEFDALYIPNTSVVIAKLSPVDELRVKISKCENTIEKYSVGGISPDADYNREVAKYQIVKYEDELKELLSTKPKLSNITILVNRVEELKAEIVVCDRMIKQHTDQAKGLRTYPGRLSTIKGLELLKLKHQTELTELLGDN